MQDGTRGERLTRRVGIKYPAHHRALLLSTVFGMTLILSAATALAQDNGGAGDTDALAKELSNPAGALASLSAGIQYTGFKGDLTGADDQHGWDLQFQPVLPFPVGDSGNNLIFRPLFPFPLDRPVFNTTRGRFESANFSGLALGDITFDLVYSGNMVTNQEKKHGLLWGFGVAGTLPSATTEDVGGKQWRLGPELFFGITRPWGLVGAVVANQWDIGGGNDASYSVLAGQYFYAYGLGNGWQIASGPSFSYDWNASSDAAWTLPVGIGLAKTTKVGGTPLKLSVQLQYFVEQPDAFGPDWLLKISISPVIQNPFVKKK